MQLHLYTDGFQGAFQAEGAVRQPAGERSAEPQTEPVHDVEQSFAPGEHLTVKAEKKKKKSQFYCFLNRPTTVR